MVHLFKIQKFKKMKSQKHDKIVIFKDLFHKSKNDHVKRIILVLKVPSPAGGRLG